MTLKNITVNTPNNTDLYFLKADGSDYVQCPIAETTHIGVLRYAPTTIGTYQGEVYANASALKQYTKFPVALTVLNVTTVDVFVSITDPSDDPDYAGWFQVGKGLPVVGTSFGLLESDVPVNSPLWIMVKDSANADVYDISDEHQIQGVVTIVSLNNGTDMELEGIYTENTKYFYGTNGEIVDSTDEDRTEIFYGMGNANGMIDLDIKTIEVSIDIPIELTAGTEGNVTGEHTGDSGWFVDVYSRVSGGTPDENEWEVFQEGVEVQADGTWTATGTIADAGTRDFMAIDTLVNASDEVDDVVVASGYILASGAVKTSYTTTIKRPCQLAIDADGNMASGGLSFGSTYYHSGGVVSKPNGVGLSNARSLGFGRGLCLESGVIYGLHGDTAIWKVNTNNTGYASLFSTGRGYGNSYGLTKDANYFYSTFKNSVTLKWNIERWSAASPYTKDAEYSFELTDIPHADNEIISSISIDADGGFTVFVTKPTKYNASIYIYRWDSGVPTLLKTISRPITGDIQNDNHSSSSGGGYNVVDKRIYMTMADSVNYVNKFASLKQEGEE